MKNKPPFLLVLLIIVFLLTALAYALQVGQTILGWNWLTALGYKPTPLYSVFKGSFLSLAFLVSGAALWTRVRWAPATAGAATVTAFIWSWVDRLWVIPASASIGSQIFLIVTSLVVLSIVEFSLYLLVPYMRQDSSLPERGK